MKITIKLNTDNDAFNTPNQNYKINPKTMLDAMEQVKNSVMELVNTEWEYTNRVLDNKGNYLGSIEIKCNKILGGK